MPASSGNERRARPAPPLLRPPPHDPTALFEAFNAGFGGKLLTVAVCHLDVFDHLTDGPSTDELAERLDLTARGSEVLVTALCAFGLLERDGGGRLHATATARRFLAPDSPHSVADYFQLAAEADGVLELRDRLRQGTPPERAQYIKTATGPSAMDDPARARWLTERLAGRARLTAPLLTAAAPLADARLLVDVGGGSGFFSIGYLQRHPHLHAVVVDLPQVIDVARENAEAHGVADRLETLTADFFTTDLPADADAVLLSNVLHDWDVPACRRLVGRCARTLAPGGRLLIHDAFLDDDRAGPLPIAIYSVILFFLTEGRAYSGAECRRWLEDVGLTTGPMKGTAVHCAVMEGRKA